MRLETWRLCVSSDRETHRRSSVEVHGLGHCGSCGARHLSLCSAVPIEQVSKLEQHSHLFEFAEGATLFDQGDAPEYIYTVVEGCIRLTTDLPDGRRQVHGFPRPGDYFGLTPQPYYDYAASALVSSRVCKISISGFELMLSEMRPFNQNMHLRDERMLCSARAHAMALGRKTALERVAGFLLETLQHPAQSAVTPQMAAELNLPMTRADIADYLGLTVETVSRSLSQLRRSGLIEFLAGNVIRVPKPVALEQATGAV